MCAYQINSQNLIAKNTHSLRPGVGFPQRGRFVAGNFSIINDLHKKFWAPWQAVEKFREEAMEVIDDSRFVVPTDLDKVKSASKPGI